jgi:CheY-like chemotaxis protein
MSTNTIRIFLAEDNAADVWLIEESLRRRSITFEIENFTTAAEGIEAVLRYGSPGAPAPDLMLLDYNLPGGHGGDILASAVENPHLSSVPKAVVTSFLQPDEVKAVMQMGAVCVINKPAGLDEFMAEVGGKVEALLAGRVVRTATADSQCSSRQS